MSCNKSYKFGSHVFQSKKTAETHISGLLNSARLGSPLTGDALETVLCLLAHHPDAANKIGSGVANIRVRRESVWGTRHFEIERVDGSTTDFSFKKCLSAPTQATLFKQACRHSIADQIILFRNSVFDAAAGDPVYCPICCTVLTPNTSHVDHIPPNTFARLVQDFIEQEHLDVSGVCIIGQNDNEMQKGFADTALRERWRAFHAARAKLRVVSVRANLSVIRTTHRASC